MYWFLFYSAVSASLRLFWFRLLQCGLSFLLATWIYKTELIQITIFQPQTKNLCCVFTIFSLDYRLNHFFSQWVFTPAFWNKSLYWIISWNMYEYNTQSFSKSNKLNVCNGISYNIVKKLEKMYTNLFL